jgi:hypothetical protein
MHHAVLDQVMDLGVTEDHVSVVVFC